MSQTITLALTGASGMPYGIRLLECLLSADVRVYLLYSQAAQIVARQEMELALPGRAKDAEVFFTQRFQIRILPAQDVFNQVTHLPDIAVGKI